MPGRIVLFGATGYTGGLTAGVLAASGAPLVLAGRSAQKLAQLRSQYPHAHIEIALADASNEQSVAELVTSDDVLVTTVGPYQQFGRPAARAAAAVGARYLDCTGEPAFLGWLVDEIDAPARATDAMLLPSFGYDYVPGQLAAMLALEAAGPSATRVRVGYFADGDGGFSRGTARSATGILLDPGYVYRGGALVRERFGRHRHTFTLHTPIRQRSAASLPGAEHLFLPRTFGSLRDVEVYLGWSERLAQVMPVGSRALDLAFMPPVLGPGLRAGLRAGFSKALSTTEVGPNQERRAKGRTIAVAEAVDDDGETIDWVQVEGPNGYDLTASLLAWAAVRLLEDPPEVYGVLGPAEAFGIEGVIELAAAVGLQRV